MSNDCGICCEKLNQSTRKEVVCVFCNYSVCRTCFQKYILETLQDPQCMNCKKIFTFDFISDNCTSIFITKNLKIHRENILFDREKSLLPETQPHVIVENQKRALKKEIELIENRKWELKRKEQLLNEEINVLYVKINRLSINNIGSSSTTTEDRKKFVRKCPMEECRGFLSTQWKCGSCDKKICNKCNEENCENHQCNPENVASMELLNKDTKPCPTCGTMIYRISGCSQMFCTDCHTAWDWNTQRVITGVIHNPHYYEFLQRNGNERGRNHGDIPCGGLPEAYLLRTILQKYNPHNLLKIHQCITHIQHHELRYLVIENVIEGNRGLRIKYLMNELSEEEFKTILQQSEKKRQKTIAFRNIYQMFVDVGSDIFRQITVYDNSAASSTIKKEFMKQQITIFENLIVYFNENLKKIGKMYKCVYPGISPTYYFVNNILTWKPEN